MLYNKSGRFDPWVDMDPRTNMPFSFTYVCVTEEHAKDIEVQTRGQSSCQTWFTERPKRLTATLCKAIVCRQKEGFTAVICNKLSSRRVSW